MAVQANKIFDDLQQCIYQLLKKLSTTTAPWTSWSIVLSDAEGSQYGEFTKPFIYVNPPVLTDKLSQQGGRSLGFYEMIIGCWVDRKTGGLEELNIMNSRLFDLFDDSKTAHTTQFTVTTNAAHTDTTLLAQGVRVEGILGPRSIPVEDRKESRTEVTIYLIA